MFIPQKPTLATLDVNVTISPALTDTQWCVYYHNVDGQTVWIGACKLNDVFHAPDARRRDAWREHVLPREKVELRVIATTEDRSEAFNFQSRLIAQYRPICNVTGSVAIGRGRRVLCNETGNEYTNASHAARELGISLPNLTNHLNGLPGFRSVNGKTFQRI